MDSGGISMSFLLHFAYRIPILLVYLAGFILAIAFWKRCPQACLLTLLAAGLEVLTIPLFAILQIYFMQSGMHWMSSLSLVGSFFHMISTVLLLLAVFIGRTRPAMPDQPAEQIQNP